MPRITALFLMVPVAISASVGCSFQHKEAGAGTNPSGTDAGAGIDRSFINGDTGGVVTGDACPSNSFMANNLPPDLLIVLDRSGSMDENSMGMTCQGGCGAASKWTQMTTAINQVVAQTQANVNWGLKLFASAGNGNNAACTVNNRAEVAPGPNNAAAIAAAIAGTNPGSSTPTRAAETQAGAYLATLTDANPKYILLATDGQPNCAVMGGNGAVDDPAAIQAVADVATMGFHTFVIGIATNGTAEGTLNSMAVNGLHPRAATPQYYPVATTADLSAALMVIQGMVALPCQFQLGGVPTDLGAVSVSIGGQVVPMNSWMYGPGNRSIIFPDAGATCASLKSGAVRDVTINLPCGVTVIP